MRYAEGSFDELRKARNYHRKREAEAIYERAIKTGDLVRPVNCERCGIDPLTDERATVRRRLHGHHADYARPLDVKWVCHSCHAAIHNELAERRFRRRVALQCKPSRLCDEVVAS